MAKVIFMDVDGVLNCSTTTDRMDDGCVGIDNKKVKYLKEIVDATGAIIVLSSDWRYDRHKEARDYLKKKLQKHGLRFVSQTPIAEDEIDPRDGRSHRGWEINEWLKRNDDIEVESWIVIDDDMFPDFEEYNIKPHLIKTSFWGQYGGLQEEDVEKAIKILNGEDNG